MSEKTLKFKNIRLNKKEFHKSKEPIELMSVNVDQIVISDKFNIITKALRILLITKKVELLNRYVLFYLKWVDTSDTFKMGAKTCLFWLEMKSVGKIRTNFWCD